MDKWLVRRTLAGDRGAAERLVSRHYASVHRFLRHLTRRSEDASDLTQLTFVKLKENLQAYREKGPFRSWLFSIAYREFLQWQRDHRNRNAIAIPESVAAEIPLHEDTLTLLQAIAGLPEELGTTFWLREVEQMSVKEVAVALSIPEGTVKSRCHLAKGRLRERLAGAWESSSDSMEADHVL